MKMDLIHRLPNSDEIDEEALTCSVIFLSFVPLLLSLRNELVGLKYFQKVLTLLLFFSCTLAAKNIYIGMIKWSNLLEYWFISCHWPVRFQYHLPV